MFTILTLAAEEKLLDGQSPRYPEDRNTVLRGEKANFEIAFCSDRRIEDVIFEIVSEIKEYVTVRRLVPVPATTVSMGLQDTDPLYVSDKPFLCPDVLVPIGPELLNAAAGVRQTLFVSVSGQCPAGVYPIRICFSSRGEKLGEVTYTLTVLQQKLGEKQLDYTNWFHYDSLALYYGKKLFSKSYNKIMDSFLSDAVAHGMNTLLIPLFTPPLDTRVGGERMTVQLIDVWQEKDGWRFGFDRLLSFLKRVTKLGIEKYEMSHLFSQWGTKTAPKIVCHSENGDKTVFGWDTPAVGGDYEKFLSSFLPALRSVLKENGYYPNCIFHISDEPTDDNLEAYEAARKTVERYLPDAFIMDALSSFAFYKRGIVTNPVTLISSLSPFLENRVENLWAYNCCGPCGDYYSNRHMGMSLVHLRIMGFCLYLSHVKGFLHWGYNFYNSAFSDSPINPYLNTDAGASFPSGDAFIVYPGMNGQPLDSIRHEVLKAAFDDLALMKRVEEKIGKAKAEKILTDFGFRPDFKVPSGGFQTHRAAREKALAALNNEEK